MHSNYLYFSGESSVILYCLSNDTKKYSFCMRTRVCIWSWMWLMCVMYIHVTVWYGVSMGGVLWLWVRDIKDDINDASAA